MKVTSAYANKLLKQLSEEKEYWLSKEKEGYLYTAAIDEEPVIPDYNYQEVSREIMDIDDRICRIKHALNIANLSAEIPIGEDILSVDLILIRMSQLNKRKAVLDRMRKQMPKTRVESGMFSSRKSVPEYRYINYDLDLIKSEYEKINKEIMVLQIALDKHNQTVEFEVE